MSMLLRGRTDALDVVDDMMRSWSQVAVDEISRVCSALCEEISENDPNEISNNVMTLATRIIELSRFSSVLARTAEELLQFAADELPLREWSTDAARQMTDGARLLRVSLGARDDALAVCALRHLHTRHPKSTLARI